MVVNDDKDKKKGATNREYLRHRLKITKHLETKQAYAKKDLGGAFEDKINEIARDYVGETILLAILLPPSPNVTVQNRLYIPTTTRRSIITVTVIKDQMMDVKDQMMDVKISKNVNINTAATYIIDLGGDYLPSFSVAVGVTLQLNKIDGFIGLYVDDLIIAGKKETINLVIDSLKKRFEMSDLGECKYV
ncbi:hypothetical protein O9G_004321 [Rozella allomycis CSF55]|uniref:Reverse transcriptase Ty1/copia-type domain-containing protein n=1 Tax=Rozella allomycis (strain CSF55) TaxID=988480 RepID=A0A075AVN8_ROZAC|nr:hypothetical protein O9G_004321 [Rozella allomycis CSF55]|eukprot:EPZ34205.1 hypothetical protein O9G_004321 [Rozella allomycis CSF55]